MNKNYFRLMAPIVILLFATCDDSANELKNGDILFQSLNSSQCEVIRIATNSEYTHCGVINIIDEGVFVLEGLQPVRRTPVKEWIDRGIDKHFVVKRLNDFDSKINAKNIDRIITVGEKYLSKDYDFFFGWSDSLIYCSELVWKVYREAWGIELCPLKKLSDFDLTHPVVRAMADERYGDNIPFDEPVAAPADLFNSEMLYEVKDIRLP